MAFHEEMELAQDIQAIAVARCVPNLGDVKSVKEMKPEELGYMTGYLHGEVDAIKEWMVAEHDEQT